MFIGSPCHADGRLSLVTIGCVDQQQTLVKAITFQLVSLNSWSRGGQLQQAGIVCCITIICAAIENNLIQRENFPPDSSSSVAAVGYAIFVAAD